MAPHPNGITPDSPKIRAPVGIFEIIELPVECVVL